MLGGDVVPLNSEDVRDDDRRGCPFTDMTDGGRERIEPEEILDMEEDGRRRCGGLISRRWFTSCGGENVYVAGSAFLNVFVSPSWTCWVGRDGLAEENLRGKYRHG